MKKYFFIFFFLLLSVKIYSQDTIYYKIAKGENLYKLSKIYEVSIDELKSLNKLTDGMLTTSQVIKIYNKKNLKAEQISLNSAVYNKELFEKKLLENNNFLEKALNELSKKSAQLTDSDEDIQNKFIISRNKSLLKDSIQTENKVLEKEVYRYNNQIDSLKIVLEPKLEKNDLKELKTEKVVKEEKSNETIDAVIKNEKKELQEKELAKRTAEKQKEKQKKDKEKAKKKATKDKELAKKTATKEKELAKKVSEKQKEKEKKDKEKAKKVALKEKEKAKKLAESGKEPKAKETEIVVKAEKTEKAPKEVKEKPAAKEPKAKENEVVVKVEKTEKAPKEAKEKPAAKEPKAKETEVVVKAEKTEKTPKEVKEKPEAKEPKAKETEVVIKVEKTEKAPKEAKEKPAAKEPKAKETVVVEVEKVEKPQHKEPETKEIVVVKKDFEPKIEVKDKKLEILSVKEIDSLKEVKRNNLIFLDESLKNIESEKLTLNPDLDLLRILYLSKQKFLITDSINKLNAVLDLKIPNTHTAEKPIKPQPKEIKEVKIEKPIEQTLVFDNDIKIDTATISKELKEKLKAKEVPSTSNISKDTNDVKINVVVKPVVVESTKTKKKFELGDVVDKQLQEKAKFFLSRAKLEIDKTNITKALDYIDKSIELNPSYVDAYVLKGDIYSSMTFYEKALGNYGRASYLEPQNAQINYNLGNCYIRLGKDNLAIEQWTKAINNDSTYILAYAGRASLFMKNNNFEAAIKDYNKIFGINKYFYEAYKGRGVAYLELGNYGKAIIDFNNYLAYEPNDDFVFWKRGLAKLSDNEIYGGCIDLLSSSDLGNKEAEKALKKHCEK